MDNAMLLNQLKYKLIKRFPEMKSFIAERICSKYINEVIIEIATQIILMTPAQRKTGEMPFNWDNVRERCGRTNYPTKNTDILNLMQDNTDHTTSLIIRMFKGNLGKYSRVVYNLNYWNDIMDELNKIDIKKLTIPYLQELEDKSNADWDIDVESLRSYISKTESDLQARGHSQNYYEKLTNNLLLSKKLLYSYKIDKDGTHYVSEYWEEIDSGRIYGHGLSLQILPKEVRNAALGHCYKYDFKACSYAVMASLAKKIDPSLKIGAVIEYIQHRNDVRQNIAQCIALESDSISWVVEQVKEVFTAYGFGAELNSNPYKSIHKRLGEDRFQKLMHNDNFNYIITGMKEINRAIDSAYPNSEFVLCGRKYSPINPKYDSTMPERGKNKQIRDNKKKLAWIFQCMEADVTSKFVNYINNLGTHNIKLICHDCVYVDKPLNSFQQADMKWMLRNEYAYIDFEETIIYPIHAESDKPVNLEKEAQIAHSEFIQLEELIAADYISELIKKDI